MKININDIDYKMHKIPVAGICMALLTGVTPDQNGICSNYYYDKRTNEGVMMNDPGYLKVPMTINLPPGFSPRCHYK